LDALAVAPSPVDYRICNFLIREPIIGAVAGDTVIIFAGAFKITSLVFPRSLELWF
jgi:hypothetical protein